MLDQNTTHVKCRLPNAILLKSVSIIYTFWLVNFAICTHIRNSIASIVQPVGEA